MSDDGILRAVATLFDRAAQTYEAVGVKFFTTFAHELLALLSPAPGECALDVGFGRGATLFPLAERVGPDGSVLGIDLSPEMVTRTARDIEERGLGNTFVALMDAQDPALSDATFDLVTASFVVFFLPDPGAGLRAWFRLLKPGGRIGMTTFGADDPRWSAVREVFRPYVPGAMAWTLAARAGLFTSRAGFEQAVENAGFTGVSTIERSYPVRFATPEQWIDWSQSHGQRVFWELVPEPRREVVHEQVLEQLRDLRDPNGSLTMMHHVRYTLAGRA